MYLLLRAGGKRQNLREKPELCFDREEERSEVVRSAAWRSRAAGVVKFTSVAAALPAASMEQLRGEPINDALLVREEPSAGCLEAGAASAAFSEHPEMIYGNLFSHQMPFLQLLQGAMQAGEEAEEEEVELHLQQYQYQHESFFTSCTQESNFQLLLRLQSQNCFKQLRTAEMDTSRVVEQLESCITHASESETRGVVHHKTPATVAATGPTRSAAGVGPNERRKRKRPRQASTSKSAQEVESQRMTHIAVERNRRRLMNDHLATLRSLMPSSYVQRGDQASIIGGAIDFVKELEQRLLSLRAQKRLLESAAVRSRPNDDEPRHTSVLHDGFFISPQYTGYLGSQQRRRDANGEEAQLEDGTGVDVEATVVQGHVNLKVAAQRRRGQLVRAIAAMEELRLSVLHLNVTSLEPSSILYSLSLKMEEACKLGSADEVATAVHQIFSYINACC
ncbi:Helix-loop-helix DNA-binding domain [Musa troglodytarum]|uniref:Helix-loop-helix DNA-binding domain n=1 Tax=Musa troglodytarum TaxID=320322 RepID=A0A9E7KN54_9LILI|nr:Helix-loop-helix DNA-binding domain [Musa troglodytarum]